MKKNESLDNEKPAANAVDVAQYIYEIYEEEYIKAPLTLFKMQKLLYYCQAWSLVWDEKPLFSNIIHKSKTGPVVLMMIEMPRNFIMKSPQGDTSLLTQEQKDTILAVCNSYGRKTAQYLCDIMRTEPPSHGQSGIVSIVDMYEYYSSIGGKDYK